MNYNTKITFYWKDKFNKTQFHRTTGDLFKYRAIELLEEEMMDKVRNIYYTVDNFITIKLDYYNLEEK